MQMFRALRHLFMANCGSGNEAHAYFHDDWDWYDRNMRPQDLYKADEKNTYAYFCLCAFRHESGPWLVNYIFTT